MNTQKAQVVVGIIVKTNPLSYLLVNSKNDFGKYTGYYYPPGGHVETGEAPLDALKREINEEVGLTVLEATYLTHTLGDIPNQITKWYRCEVDCYNLVIDNTELFDAGFFTQDQILSMKIWPTTLEILRKYIF